MKLLTTVTALFLSAGIFLPVHAAKINAAAHAQGKLNRDAINKAIQKLTRLEKFLGNVSKNLGDLSDVKTPVDGMLKNTTDLKTALGGYKTDPQKAEHAKTAFAKIAALPFFKQVILAHDKKGPGKGKGLAKGKGKGLNKNKGQEKAAAAAK